MRDKQHYLDLIERNPAASVGFTLAASAIYAMRYGVCENEHRTTNEWRAIALDLKSRYGETLSAAEMRQAVAEAQSPLGESPAAAWTRFRQRIQPAVDDLAAELMKFGLALHYEGDADAGYISLRQGAETQ